METETKLMMFHQTGGQRLGWEQDFSADLGGEVSIHIRDFGIVPDPYLGFSVLSNYSFRNQHSS